MTAPPRRRTAPRPLADLVESCLGGALAKQGFAGADILVNWPEIAGETLARRSQPMKLVWPRKPQSGGPADPATLVVRVESAFALDLQHLAPLVIERVNAYFGWACVGRLRLEQGPVRRPAAPAPRPQPSPAEQAEADAAAAGVADPALREALARLGAAVFARERRAGAKS
jgi:hypothetical protein